MESSKGEGTGIGDHHTLTPKNGDPAPLAKIALAGDTRKRCISAIYEESHSMGNERERLANGCFVCGPTNDFGLNVQFRLEEDVCRAEFTPQQRHAGYDQVTHGGLLFALLDDVMANWLWLQGLACFTARAEIRYRQPLPIGTPVRLEGRCERRRGRLALMNGRVLTQESAQVVAEASARFMLRDDVHPTHCDPTYADLNHSE